MGKHHEWVDGGILSHGQESGWNEVVRIDPGGKYTVVWKLNRLTGEDSDHATKHALRRIQSALKDFSFFNPGKSKIFSTVLIWSVPPKTGADGDVMNVGDAFPLSVSLEIEMDASPWVLILGAAVGGSLCFALQALVGVIDVTSGGAVSSKTIIIGVSTATLLCGVVTVLISRLAKTDFLLSLKVNDLWGAITTGFVVQWFGYKVLLAMLPAVTKIAH
jgi:hypothetical protein